MKGAKFSMQRSLSKDMSYCGWTKSCTTLKPWLKPLVIGIYKGLEPFPGFLGGANWISQPSAALDLTRKHRGFKLRSCNQSALLSRLKPVASRRTCGFDVPTGDCLKHTKCHSWLLEHMAWGVAHITFLQPLASEERISLRPGLIPHSIQPLFFSKTGCFLGFLMVS